MTPQELDARLEQLAIAGATPDTLAALMLSVNVPQDRATKIANDWVNYARQTKSPTASSEFERMVLIFAPRCKQVYDPMELTVESPEQWAKNIAREAITYLREKDEDATMKIGTKVRELKLKVDENDELFLDDNGHPVLDFDTNGGKQYVNGYYREGVFVDAPGKYGIVVGNPATIDAELKPFDGYEHNLDDLRVRPIVRDGVEASPEVQNEHKPKPVQGYELGDPAVNDQTGEFDTTLVEFLSTMIHVQWHFADGTAIEESVPWHPLVSLEEIP